MSDSMPSASVEHGAPREASRRANLSQLAQRTYALVWQADAEGGWSS
jgi:hypothetical protein